MVYCPFKHECKQSQNEVICAFYTRYGVISWKKKYIWINLLAFFPEPGQAEDCGIYENYAVIVSQFKGAKVKIFYILLP